MLAKVTADVSGWAVILTGNVSYVEKSEDLTSWS